MDFVSKDQTYEATRKLLLEQAAALGEPRLEQLARDMQMDGDHSRVPELYQRFLDTLRSDPLEPHTALDAAAQFLSENVRVNGNPNVEHLIQAARETAEDPETGDRALWNHWVELLGSV